MSQGIYRPGDKVRIISGEFAGQVMTVAEATDSEIWLVERPKSRTMSRLNVEPAEDEHA